MIRRTWGELQSLLKDKAVRYSNGNGDGQFSIKGVSTDTRTIQAGNLFVPLIGENFDGHAYVADAYAAGASAALWQINRPHPPAHIPLIYVEDTLTALQQLAAGYREQLPVQIIGITGSNGKTTTKDLVASVLSTTFKVHKTKGNFNNHIGLPLTLLQLEEDTEFAVLEMGMRGRGEIELLSLLAKPEAVIITMIGEAHMLHLGSREEIARAKTEILSGLKNGGWFIYNGDEPLIELVLPEMTQPKAMNRLCFGEHDGNDLYPTDVELTSEGTHFKINKTAYPVLYIPLLGQHNVINALAAIAAGEAYGVTPENIAAGLKTLQMTSMRIERLIAETGLTVLNDAYNASPASMQAAISLTEQLVGYSRKIVVLGDMLELGAEEEQYHRSIGQTLTPEHIDIIFTYGRLAGLIADEAEKTFPQGTVYAFEDKEKLIKSLSGIVKPEDVVLVKGSRGMQLEQVVHALLDDA
jgi:UDP-N-acetylmuramoyl-tripeptide--D-alanyl-D-alanine ligase